MGHWGIVKCKARTREKSYIGKEWTKILKELYSCAEYVLDFKRLRQNSPCIHIQYLVDRGRDLE